MDLIQQKTALRAHFRAARAALPAGEAEAAARRIAQAALAFLDAGAFAPDAPVALYAALPGELDCAPLLAALAARGVPTLLPVAGAKATPLAFRLWRPGDPLEKGRFGVVEPPGDAPALIPKILFAPLLAFDGEGTRLGFGGGYYDATLAHLRAQGLLAAGGLAFACQKAEKIPREAHDERLDFVVTEEKVFQFTETA